MSCDLFISVAGKKPLTINKAQRENLRHQRFPIDRYVKYVFLFDNIIPIIDYFSLDLVVEVEKH